MDLLKKFILMIIAISTLCIGCGKVSFAEEQDRNLILVVIPDFSFQEVKWLNENGQFPELWNNGGVAAMNIRPDGPYSYLNNAVSLSTGIRGVGVEGWNAYSKGEKVDGINVEDLYQQWTGKIVNEGSILHPLIHKLVDKNYQTTYRGEVGYLGQTLKENNVKTYVIGNSDFGNEKIRYGPLFTMDYRGFTSGELSDAIKGKAGSPYGIVMDVDHIYHSLSTVTENNGASFTVIEWGDLYRLFKQKRNMSNEYFQEQYKGSLLQLEEFLNNLKKLNFSHSIMMFSPMVHTDAYKNKEQLAPYFYWSKALQSQPIYLQSQTTRQPFVISNLDVVPTILDFFNIDGFDLMGKPIQKKIAVGPILEEGLKNIDLIFLIYKTRNFILSSYITLLVLLLLIVSIIIIIKEKKDLWKKVARILLISGISSPLWLLVTPYILSDIRPSLYLLILLFCSLFTGYLFVNYIHNPIFTICLSLFFMISIDLFLGNPLMRRSYLGYDPIIGARYYGIGNEFAGVYLICGLLLLERQLFRTWFVFIGLVFAQIVILSGSSFGANAGATLSASIMFVYFSVRNFFIAVHWRKLLIYVIAMLPVALFVLFLLQYGKETHISYAFSKLFQGEFSYIGDTIKRKLEMNWKIFRFSNWTQLFVTTYLIIALYLWRGKNIVSDKIKRLLIQTGIVASVALLLLNDSGVVAAATSMFIIVCTSYYWALEED